MMKIWKRVVCMTLFAVMLFSCLPEFSVFAAPEVWDKSVSEAFEGNGTEDAPYLIQNGADLALLSSLVAVKDGKSTNCFEGVFFKMTADIDMGKNSLTMIGNHSVKDDLKNSTKDTAALAWFCGTFDGDGHVISNLKINHSGDSTKQRYVGLFSAVKGTVKNLGIESGDVKGKENVGSIAGVVFDSGVIENCWNAATVYSGLYLAGGIAGWTYGTIRNCSNFGTLTCWGTDKAVCGGLVGYAKTGTKIENSFASACMDSKLTLTYVGGLIGKADKDGTKSKTEVSNSCFVRVAGGPEKLVCTGYANNTEYKNDFGDTNAAVTEAQAKSGEIAYRLGAVFGQKLGTDENPIPNSPDKIAFNGEAYVNTNAGHLLQTSTYAYIQSSQDRTKVRVIFVNMNAVSIPADKTLTLAFYAPGDDGTLLNQFTVTGDQFDRFVCVDALGEWYYAEHDAYLFGVVVKNIPEGVLTDGVRVDVSFGDFSGSAEF